MNNQIEQTLDSREVAEMVEKEQGPGKTGH